MKKELETINKKIDDLADIVAKGFCNLQDQMDKRFLEVDKQFESMQDQMDKRFLEVDKRFESMQDQMDKRFLEVDKRFIQVDHRFEQIDARHDSILTILDRHTKLLMENRVERVATIHGIDRLEKDIIKIKKKIKLAN